MSRRLGFAFIAALTACATNPPPAPAAATCPPPPPTVYGKNCVLKTDVLGIGYPLFGSILFAVIWGAGAAAIAIIARRSAAREAFESFVRSRLRREIAAWAICLMLCTLPVVRYAWVTGAVSLFP